MGFKLLGMVKEIGNIIIISIIILEGLKVVVSEVIVVGMKIKVVLRTLFVGLNL